MFLEETTDCHHDSLIMKNMDLIKGDAMKVIYQSREIKKSFIGHTE